MTKHAEHQQNVQPPLYPTQMPAAPPTYDEAVYGPQANPAYPAHTPANPLYPTQQSVNPLYPTQQPLYPTQPTTSVFTQSNTATGQFVPAAGTYVHPPVVEIQRTVIALPLGPNPANIKCPNCQYDIRTSIYSEPSCAAHLCCLLLLLIGCCPLSSLPYCMESLRTVRHSCPNCHSFLGYYQP